MNTKRKVNQERRCMPMFRTGIRAGCQPVWCTVTGMNSLQIKPHSFFCFISVMHETGRQEMEVNSLHPQNHLGVEMSSYLLPQHERSLKGGHTDVKAHSLSLFFFFLKLGHCFSPENVSSQPVSASFPELWCLLESARHLKDLGLQLSKCGPLWQGVWESRGSMLQV